MKENKHLQSIPADVLAQAQTKIDEAIALLAPYTLSLPPGERRDILKMGEKSLSFVEKAHEYAKQNPNFCPPYLNITEFDTDFGDAHGLWTLCNSALQFYEGIDDTAMLRRRTSPAQRRSTKN